MSTGTGTISRRTFCAMLSAAATTFAQTGGQTSGGSASGVSASAAKPILTPVPPSVSGITWSHTNGRSPDYFLPETTGAGCAFFDFDNDGWMDIYLVNSGEADFYHPTRPLRNALYRNNRDGTFTDVTMKAGVPGAGYGMGVAVGDYNRDGFADLFVTGYNRSILYRNNGNGTFTDVTESSGIAVNGWATSAAWFDYDNDGQLDLFVCHFVQYTKEDNRACGDGTRSERHYCVPRFYKPSSCWLFRNNGDGTFTDVSEKAGLKSLQSKAWGVVTTDVNRDGQIDLFVANDTTPNFLLINDHGVFKDVALEANVAYSSTGVARSGMGVDAADISGKGDDYLFVSNVDREMYALYQNTSNGDFDDLAATNGMAMSTGSMSGWGAKFFDYDNDGNTDLLIVNGHPDDQIELSKPAIKYLEPMLLFHNNGQVLRDVSADAGPIFRQPLAARGLAVGDFNNDGRVDALVAINNGQPILLRNTCDAANHWIGLELRGTVANIDAIGARVVWKAGGLTRACSRHGGGSFMSSHDPRLVLGLGSATEASVIEVHWPLPSTRVDRFTNVRADRYYTLVEAKQLVDIS